MKGARRAAARTLPTRHRPKRALGKESYLGRIEGEQQNSRGGHAQPNSRCDGELPSSIGGRVNKMKTSHDLKTLTE